MKTGTGHIHGTIKGQPLPRTKKGDGVILDAQLNSLVREFLAVHPKTTPIREKGANRKQTTIKTPEDVAVYLLQLEHY